MTVKIPQKKCLSCKKIIKKNDAITECCKCFTIIHLTCSNIYPSNCLNSWHCTNCTFKFLPFEDIDDTQIYLDNLGLPNVSENLKIFPHDAFNEFIIKCSAIFDKLINSDDNEEGISIPINSSYYDIHKFNQIKTDHSSSLGIIHTNLASINKILMT